MTQFSNEKAARIGYLTGRGLDSIKIALDLNDDTTPATVRRMWKHWGLVEGTGRAVVEVPVPLEAAHRRKLERQANILGIEPSEFIRRIAICAVEDDLYQAVTDGRFD